MNAWRLDSDAGCDAWCQALAEGAAVGPLLEELVVAAGTAEDASEPIWPRLRRCLTALGARPSDPAIGYAVAKAIANSLSNGWYWEHEVAHAVFAPDVPKGAPRSFATLAFDLLVGHADQGVWELVTQVIDRVRYEADCNGAQMGDDLEELHARYATGSRPATKVAPPSAGIEVLLDGNKLRLHARIAGRFAVHAAPAPAWREVRELEVQGYVNVDDLAALPALATLGGLLDQNIEELLASDACPRLSALACWVGDGHEGYRDVIAASKRPLETLRIAPAWGFLAWQTPDRPIMWGSPASRRWLWETELGRGLRTLSVGVDAPGAIRRWFEEPLPSGLRELAIDELGRGCFRWAGWRAALTRADAGWSLALAYLPSSIPGDPIDRLRSLCDGVRVGELTSVHVDAPALDGAAVRAVVNDLA